MYKKYGFWGVKYGRQEKITKQAVKQAYQRAKELGQIKD